MWVTVRDAAALLGVSEDTVRRRMKAGALPARQDPTRSGFRWLVELPDPAPASPPQTDVPDSTPAPARPSEGELAALRELVDALQRERVTLVEELAARRFARAMQRAQGEDAACGPPARPGPAGPHRVPSGCRSWHAVCATDGDFSS